MASGSNRSSCGAMAWTEAAGMHLPAGSDRSRAGQEAPETPGDSCCRDEGLRSTGAVKIGSQIRCLFPPESKPAPTGTNPGRRVGSAGRGNPSSIRSTPQQCWLGETLQLRGRSTARIYRPLWRSRHNCVLSNLHCVQAGCGGAGQPAANTSRASRELSRHPHPASSALLPGIFQRRDSPDLAAGGNSRGGMGPGMHGALHCDIDPTAYASHMGKRLNPVICGGLFYANTECLAHTH